MLEIIPIQSLGIAENGGRFLERNAVLSQVANGLASVPRKHINVYTLIKSRCQIGLPVHASRIGQKSSFLMGRML
jgi:hypothetical protein